MAWSTKINRCLGVGMVCTGCATTVLATDDASSLGDALLDMSLDDLMKVTVSTGVRFEGHTLKDTPLSLVSLSAEDLRTAHGGSNDLNMVLRELVPSFNYLTQPVNDAMSHVRPFSLRGLPPDETLVLVNGKRFHRSALVQVGGSPITLGSQATDLSQLPAFGLKRIEVLRDGASAQYGSDAIAGVINLILSDRAEGGEVQVQRGGTKAGDGDETRVSLNAGTGLGEKGFFNLSGEFVDKNEVSRGMQRPDAAYYATQGLAVADPAQIWGTPILDSTRLLWNARLNLANGSQAYMFGNFSDAHSDASFNYRALTRGLFTSNLDTTDGNPLTNVHACPAVPGDQFGFQQARNCLALAQATPGLFNFQSWFPAGFTPRLVADTTDFSQTVGVNGEMWGGSTYDVSFSYARNNINLHLNRTVNASLGPNSPTSFNLGSFQQTERNLNADFVWPVTPKLSLAAGAEWRQEIYAPEAGEPASWQTGPYSQLTIGANGMPGIDPAAVGRFQRRNVSAYIDSQYHFSTALLISAAARYEHYSDFGNTTTGKLALRYLLNDSVTLRGTAGSGFRAPSPGQANLTNISHIAGGGGAQVQVQGTIPPTNPIAQFFGARPLEPELSRNLSLGVAYQRNALSLAVDVFRIKVKDRIQLSSALTLTPAVRVQMLAAGITNSDDYDTISVFNNAADSISQGVDVSAGYQLDSSVGHTELKLDLSRMNTRITPNGSGFTPTEQNLYNLANQMPKTRAVLAVRHRYGDWTLSANTVYYGSFSVDDGSIVTKYSSKSVSNIELGFASSNRKEWTFAAGIGNVFDMQAHKQDSLSIGSPFLAENPFEYQGRSYYASAKYTF